MRRLLLPCLLFAFSLIFVTGCGEDATAPVGVDDGTRVEFFEGLYQGEEVVLQRASVVTPDGPVLVELVATGIAADIAAGFLDLDVALRNVSQQDLYGPARVFVGQFNPPSIVLMNGDEQLIDPAPGMVWPLPHLFDYTAALGEDGILGPREQSASRTWRFGTGNLNAFSFAAIVEFGVDPARSIIGGHVFLDLDRDGQRDPNEPPGYAMGVRVSGPNGEDYAPVDSSGAWRVPIERPGLYTCTTLMPPTMDILLPVCFTTPNPLYVVIPVLAQDGTPPYERADFGIDPEPCIPNQPTVEIVDAPIDSFDNDAVHIEGEPRVEGAFLYVTASFSGCGPDHPFRLITNAAFMESYPPQVRVRLLHDDLGELCAAYFTRELRFDLGPLLRLHHVDYGETGPFYLLLMDELTGTVYRVLVP